VTSILVTGGAGYIGSHTCKALRRAGFDPITYDNLTRGTIRRQSNGVSSPAFIPKSGAVMRQISYRQQRRKQKQTVQPGIKKTASTAAKECLLSAFEADLQ
jgi:UDP-glucose 4-epimerase